MTRSRRISLRAKGHRTVSTPVCSTTSIDSREAAFDAGDHFGWVACDNRTTRAVAKVFREDYNIPRKSVEAQSYWVA